MSAAPRISLPYLFVFPHPPPEYDNNSLRHYLLYLTRRYAIFNSKRKDFLVSDTNIILRVPAMFCYCRTCETSLCCTLIMYEVSARACMAELTCGVTAGSPPPGNSFGEPFNQDQVSGRNFFILNVDHHILFDF